MNQGILATAPWTSLETFNESWWLRSPGYYTGAFTNDDPMNNHFAAGVSNHGDVDERGFSVSNCCYGVRPAFYLNRNSVLLTSAAEGGKSSFEDGKLSEVGENTSGAWRLTLLDDGSADAVGNGHRNFAIDAAGVIYDEDTKEVTIPYTGATAGKNEYISAVIKNGEQIKAYGRIAKASAAAGAAVRVRLDRLEKGDALYVFNEQYNGDRKTDGGTVTQAETDYASGLKRVPVASPYWTGSGTEEAPFVISDQKGWEELAELVDNGFKTEDVFFTLDEDINSSVMVGKKDHPFEGILDGGGHILQADIKTDTSSAAAPFGVIKDAEIRNLIVKGTVEGGRHSAGLVVSTYGQCIITACDVHTAVTAPDYCGGIIGHGTESETTVEGCVFRGSLTGTAAGGANAGGIWGWSDPGAKPTIVNCLEAGSYTNVKLNPIGIGKSQNGGDIQTTYYTTGILGSPAESWNAYGSPVHTLTADEGIVPGFDTEKKTEYKAIGLLVSDCGALTDGVVYAPENATVTITLPSVCDDFKLQPETVERKGELPNCTITMPKENVTVKLKEGANHSWKFSGFHWKGSSKDGNTAEAALYVCEHDGKHRERVSKVTVTSKVTAPTSTAAGFTTYLASVSAKDSLDGQAHKESKTGKPVPKQGIDRAKAKISLDAGIKGTSSKGTVTARWGKVKDADYYEVYAAYCAGNSKYRKIQTVSGSKTKFIIKKLAGKKLNPNRCVKYYVVACKNVNGKKIKLAKSLPAHVVGSANKGWSNIKSIKVTKKAWKIRKGKTAKIKAKLVLYQKGKKTLDHERKFRYATSNGKVATVSKKGKIKAVGKGKCDIYVYAQNGCARKIKVTVR